MDRCNAIKACSGMLRSYAFATSNYRDNCEKKERNFRRDEKTQVDHIIDLELVSECFCDAFLGNSLRQCLQVRK